jgi:hypothetical protein
MALPELGVQVVDLSERSLQVMLERPTGVVSAERSQIRDPPAVIAATRAVHDVAGHLVTDNSLAERGRLTD